MQMNQAASGMQTENKRISRTSLDVGYRSQMTGDPRQGETIAQSFLGFH